MRITQYGIIDIGSNTVVLAIYESDGKTFKQTFERSQTVHLVGYVENGKMRQEGLDAAYRTIYEYMGILMMHRVDNVYAEITACGRNISNPEDLIKAVKRAGCQNVRILTGEEEAMCDYWGAVMGEDVSDGLMIDIGGGSTEFVRFKDKKIEAVHSIPMGCVKLMHQRYDPSVSLPYIEQMRAADPKFTNTTHAIGVGGTIRFTTYILQELIYIDHTFTNEQFHDLYDRLRNEDIPAVKALWKRVSADRQSAMIPGMGMLAATMDSFGVELVSLSEYGVREGFLAHYILHII